MRIETAINRRTVRLNLGKAEQISIECRETIRIARQNVHISDTRRASHDTAFGA